MIDASKLIKYVGKNYTVNRATGTYVAGVWTPNAPTVLTVLASVQPLNAADTVRVPEGERSRQRLKAYTVTPLLTVGDGRKADVMVVDGVGFEVESSDPWQGDFYRVVLVKQGG